MFIGTFKITAQSKRFIVNYPCSNEISNKTREKVSMILDHFPVLCNYATTGHKLQGKSVDKLVISEWINTENWAYVVLSRVKTLSGIFLWKALPDDTSFAPNEEYLQMMQRLRETILAKTV
jgi:hypothetical protein